MRKVFASIIGLMLVVSVFMLPQESEASGFKYDFSCEYAKSKYADTGLDPKQNQALIDHGIPMCIQVISDGAFKNLILNGAIYVEGEDSYVVYGKPTDVPNNDSKPQDRNGVKGTQYRYLGYLTGGIPYPNPVFPPDSLYNTHR